MSFPSAFLQGFVEGMSKGDAWYLTNADAEDNKVTDYTFTSDPSNSNSDQGEDRAQAVSELNAATTAEMDAAMIDWNEDASNVFVVVGTRPDPTRITHR